MNRHEDEVPEMLRRTSGDMVFTEVINMKVCEACAAEARRLGIAVEALDVGERKRNRQAS